MTKQQEEARVTRNKVRVKELRGKGRKRRSHKGRLLPMNRRNNKRTFRNEKENLVFIEKNKEKRVKRK